MGSIDRRIHAVGRSVSRSSKPRSRIGTYLVRPTTAAVAAAAAVTVVEVDPVCSFAARVVNGRRSDLEHLSEK